MGAYRSVGFALAFGEGLGNSYASRKPSSPRRTRHFTAKVVKTRLGVIIPFAQPNDHLGRELEDLPHDCHLMILLVDRVLSLIESTQNTSTVDVCRR
jgi:hypothetical protein